MDKTNFVMVNELKNTFSPKRVGIISMDEIYTINEKLELDKRNILDLRNLRDFVVLYFSHINTEDKFDFKLNDLMSAVVSVIDQKIWNIGGEV